MQGYRSKYQAWATKQRGNPMFLLIGGVGLSVCFYMGYRRWYLPSARRKKLKEAEQYATLLYEAESK